MKKEENANNASIPSSAMIRSSISPNVTTRAISGNPKSQFRITEFSHNNNTHNISKTVPNPTTTTTTITSSSSSSSSSSSGSSSSSSKNEQLYWREENCEEEEDNIDVRIWFRNKPYNRKKKQRNQ